MGNTKELTKKEECLKALQCLYIAVGEPVANDVKRKVLDALEELEAEIIRLRKLLYQVEVKMEQDNMNNDYDGVWRDSDEDILANVKAESLEE